MFKIQYRNKDKVIVERFEARVPETNEMIAFFSYNKDLNTKEMQINQYYVIQIVSMLRDPVPAENFTSIGVGDEKYIIFLQPKEEYEAMLRKKVLNSTKQETSANISVPTPPESNG